ncbi:MAG: hypothetical protein ACRD7E_15740 [Bryobacteraceae bacterium]
MLTLRIRGVRLRQVCQCDTLASMVPIILMLLFLAELLPAQSAVEDYNVYAEHPRLLLQARRLRLLRRERERQSPRWKQFAMLVQGKARMPEPGFALGLFYQVSGDRQAGRSAVEWAVGPGTDLRQLALVYDWCQPLLSEAEKETLAAKLKRGLGKKPGGSDPAEVRSRAFAAIALADQQELSQIVQTWWRSDFAPRLRAGKAALPHRSVYPLFELLHSLRDNLHVDLREDAGAFFKDLPSIQLLSYYPASYPAAENDYRIPAYAGRGEPDLNEAALSRAAEFSMVAYDSNAVESQFLQGWLTHDRFVLRSPFGAPYEYLWANPYQPGLSYFHMPLSFHDRRSGQLYVRSSWEEDAEWLGYFDGKMQMFSEGKIRNPGAAAPLERKVIGDAVLVQAEPGKALKIEAGNPEKLYILGLEPRQIYDIEVDDEELTEQRSDSGGIVSLTVAREEGVGVRLRARPAN